MATNKDEVRAIMRRHPRWGSRDIAELIGCTEEYVRATCKRYGWILPTMGRVPQMKIPLEWVDNAKLKGETTRQCLERLFCL